MKFVLLIIGLFFSLVLEAQEATPELIRLSQSPIDSIRFNALRDLCYAFEFTDSSKAMYYYRQAMQLAVLKNNPLWICKAYTDFGNVSSNAGDFNVAKEYHQRSLQFAQLSGNQSRIAAALNNIANTFGNRKIIDSAISYTLKSIQLLEKNQNQEMLLVAYSNVATYFNEIANFNEGLHYALKAFQIAQLVDDTTEMVMSNNQAARSYYHLGDTAAFKRTLKNTQKLIPSIHDLFVKALAFQNVGAYYMYINDRQSALPMLDSAMKLSYHLENTQFKISAFVAKGDWFVKSGMFSKGEDLMNAALPLAKEARDLSMLREIFTLKYIIAEKRGNYKDALEYMKQVLIYKDSIYSNEVAKATTEMQERFEAEKKQFRIDELNNQQALTEAQNSEQRIWIFFLIGLSVAAVAAIFLIYRNHRKGKIIDQQHLELK